MSLTSYRAAPPRGNVFRYFMARYLLWRALARILIRALGLPEARTAAFWAAGLRFWIVKRNLFVFGRPGGDLLSRVLRQSTIGAEAFDGRVRDGIGSGHFARATRPAKDKQGSPLRLRGLEARDGIFRSLSGLMDVD
jgi:hypothetical protein